MEDWIGARVWRVGRTAEDRLMWMSGWDKCLESGTTSGRSADVEDWMGQVSGEWDD